jgi:hypothetical protein
MKESEHPLCLLQRCPGYPCRIFDQVSDKPVVCNEPGFWEKPEVKKYDK